MQFSLIVKAKELAIFKESFFYITAHTVKEWFVFSKPAVMNYLGGLKIIKWDNGFMIMHGKIIMFGYNSGPLRPCLYLPVENSLNV